MSSGTNTPLFRLRRLYIVPPKTSGTPIRTTGVPGFSVDNFSRITTRFVCDRSRGPSLSLLRPFRPKITKVRLETTSEVEGDRRRVALLHF